MMTLPAEGEGARESRCSSLKRPVEPDRRRVVLVEDEPDMLENLARTLKRAGYDCVGFGNGSDGLEYLLKHETDLMITDLKLPGMDGIEVMETAKVRQPELPVILLTAYGTVPTAVEAMRKGAFEFLCKPVDPDLLRDTVRRALDFGRLDTETAESLKGISFPEIVGGSTVVQRALELARRAAIFSTSHVVVTGETGTGKGLVARGIHEQSPDSEHPFITVDCGALPADLVESELFGCKKGAFSGADVTRPGLLQAAGRGSLFLDEIGELPFAVQSKLLRTLENREYRRLGSLQTLKLEARVIAATNRNLDQEVEQGRFRADLLYRLRVIEICLPSLRERREDIPQLCAHFLATRAGVDAGTAAPRLSSEALECMMMLPWPGNVRQLKNCLDHAVARASDGMIFPYHLPDWARPQQSLESDQEEGTQEDGRASRRRTLQSFDRDYIVALLTRTDMNVTRAAKEMGVDRRTLQRLMKRYSILGR